MAETLYEILKGTDRYIKEGPINSAEQPFNNHKGMQKLITLVYPKNTILDNAIKKIKSIEETVEELNAGFEGYRRFFPHRKDNEHNKKVDELSQLIPSYILKKDGFLGNEVPSLTELTIFCAGIGYMTKYIIYGLLNSAGGKISIEDPLLFSTPIIASFGGIVLGLALASNSSKTAKKAKEEAKYLDSKIRELI